MNFTVLLRFPPGRPVCVAVALLATTACGPQQAVRRPAPPPDPAAQAETYLRSGNYAAAAAAYQNLAAPAGSGSAAYLMRAALAYQDADDFDTANALLAAPATTEPAAAPLQALANARTLLREGLAEQAHGQLAGTSATAFEPHLRATFYRVLGRTNLLLGNYPEAVEVLLAADKLPLPADKKGALQHDIWNAVSYLNDRELLSLGKTADATAAGWSALALTVDRYLQDSAVFTSQIAQWREQFPAHGATAEVVDRLLEMAENFAVRPRKVALLLPFGGRFDDAATAIRDGFLTAWYGDPDRGSRPNLEIYRADETNVAAVYERARSEGAELVVGPLAKEAVDVLGRNTELPIPILALNVGDARTGKLIKPTNASAPSFYQFGLVPEDEARQVAARAWADGRLRAIALTPESSWGKRLLEAFRQRWEDLGGTLLNGIAYTSDTQAYAMSVKQALNVDLSEARAAALRRRLGRQIEFEPRRRADVDFIFLAGFPTNARQVLPQLRYFRAESVPVYATSHVFNGMVDADPDQDLDGVMFGDMPWLLGAADTASFDIIRRNWREQFDKFPRLFAFGIDAYRVIPYLNRMSVQRGTRVPGTTGQLHMDAYGRIDRDLTWMRFSGGVPKVIGLADRRSE